MVQKRESNTHTNKKTQRTLPQNIIIDAIDSNVPECVSDCSVRIGGHGGGAVGGFFR